MVVKKGNTVGVHYIGTFEDGTEFDNSYSSDTPINFEVGSGQTIKGFDDAVFGMEIGEKKDINIPYSEAYGEPDPAAIQNVQKTQFPDDFEFVAGGTIQGTFSGGQNFMAKIVEVEDESVVLDFNHPLAGKNLNFSIELVSIE